MSSSLKVNVALSHPYIPSSTYLEEPSYALLDIQPMAGEVVHERPPLNLAIVLDSSATMHHFQFTEEEREYYMSLAISRNEITRGKADDRDAVYWTGQTMREIQSSATTPMSIVVQAIKQMLGTLTPNDRVAVIAFADRVHMLFGDQDWAAFPERCSRNLDELREQRLPIDIGTGTYMAEAINTAGQYLMKNGGQNSVNRLIIITDGIVQDSLSTLKNVTALQEQGYAITTVGVGEEFDEEFLIRIADNSRGEYHYAADSAGITQCLNLEMSALQSISVTDMYIAISGLKGAMIQEIYMIRPSMTLFDEIYTEDEWIRARIGDVSSANPVGVLVHYIPPNLPNGTHPVVEAQFTWSYTSSAFGSASKGNQRVAISGEFTDNPTLLAKTDASVIDLVDRFSVFRYEREAQRAQERGDIGLAKEKLGAATKQLRKLGEDRLADDMDYQITSIGDANADTSRLKRIKSTTRRLGNTAPGSGPSSPGSF